MLFIRPTIIRSTEGYARQSQRKLGKFDAEQQDDRELNDALRGEIAGDKKALDNRAFLATVASIDAFYLRECAREAPFCGAAAAFFLGAPAWRAGR